MHSECRVFISASLCLSEWITAQPFVKEESLTDWLLYRLSKNLPSLKYKEFNRHEEARTGADWEWWLIGNSESLCLRVQASLPLATCGRASLTGCVICQGANPSVSRNS